MIRATTTTCALALGLFAASSASAQTSGTPPADLSATVAAPTAVGAPPGPPPPATDSTNAAVSAGGQLATGNSRSVAMTGTGKFDMRRGPNAFGVAVIGNYAEAYVTPGPTYVPAYSYTPTGSTTAITAPAHIINAAPAGWAESTENLQGKLRYDRYLSDNFSVFAQVTGTHDSFQALTFRANIDLGVKYLFLNKPKSKIWFEAGYDFQYDDNYVDGNGIEQAGAGGPQADALGIPYLIKNTDTIHSGRLFAGGQHAFNKEITLNVGLEYLQGFGGDGGAVGKAPMGYYLYDSATGPQITAASMAGDTAIHNPSISTTGSRLNFNALLAAHITGGISLGVGFQMRYNSAPLPGKVDVDTASTLTLIYAFGSAPPVPPPPPPPVPCVTPPPPPPPGSAPVVVVTAPANP